MYLGDLNFFEQLATIGFLLSLGLFVPTSTVMLFAYFFNKSIKKYLVAYWVLLPILLITPLTLFVLVKLLAVMYHSTGVMIFIASMIIFFTLQLVFFRKNFLLRLKHLFYWIFCNELPQKYFGKSISNTWLLILFIISLSIAYYSGLYNYVKLFITNIYGTITAINIIVLMFDLLVYIIWRNLFFK